MRFIGEIWDEKVLTRAYLDNAEFVNKKEER